MTQAIVIRTGDPALAERMARTFEAPELRRLRAALGVRQNRDTLYWQDKIAEAQLEYAVQPMPAWKQRVWGLLGLLTLLFVESSLGEEVPE